MNTDSAKLGRASAAFAVAASITVPFSTGLAWAKDAYRPLNNSMNAIAWYNWITHGFADVIFLGLGLIFSRTNFTGRIAPNRVILFLVAAVIVSGLGLLVWYAVVT